MLDVIGEILPIALVVGMSPVPVAAVILLLSSPRAVPAGASFLLGWSVAIAGCLTVIAALVEPADEGAGDPSLWVALGKLVLGAVMLVLAVRQWPRSTAREEQPSLPAWLASLERATPRRAMTLGFSLAALNPKHFPMFLAGGFTLGAHPLPAEGVIVAAAVFVAVASAPVAIPVVGCLVAPRKVRGPLEALRVWLTLNNAMVMALLLLVIGTAVIGSGLSDL